MKTQLTALIFLVCATTALAHSGVKNPEVMARMNLMSQIADDMKILGGIAKGAAEFDAQVVKQRAASLAQHAGRIEDLFKSQATDPKSEATETIWTDWKDFSAVANQMESAAVTLGKAADPAEFQQAFKAVGQTCSACHKSFRIKK